MTVSGPKCPNHRVLLHSCKDGIGICPISDCRFTYDEDEDEKRMKAVLNAMGEVEYQPDYKVKQADGGSGG